VEASTIVLLTQVWSKQINNMGGWIVLILITIMLYNKLIKDE